MKTAIEFMHCYYTDELLLFSKPGGEMPDLQQYISVLDDTVKTLKIDDN
jgi:hypothetical protein